MKISFSNKDIKKAPAGYTRIRIVEDGKTRFIKKGRVETLEIGSKKWAAMTRRRFILLCRQIVSTAKQNKIKKIAVQLNKSPFPQLKNIPLAELGAIIAESFEMANYEFTAYKTKPKEGWNSVDEILMCGNTSPDMQEGFKKGQVIAAAINAARDLSNTPGGDMTPKLLAEAAKKAAKGTKIKVKVLGRKEMQRLGMGAVLGMAKGSSEEPQFIIAEYWGTSKKEKPVVLVGKGVTFDTGGLQIKGDSHMYEMHMDMSGGAAAIHATVLAAKLKLKANVVALVPAVENSPGGNAVRPGDVLTSLSGKTIETLHTDAEGRVIIADGITYAKRYNPAMVVDVGTFTGASLIALGEQASAFMTNEQGLNIADYMHLAEESGDYIWPLPLWEEYDYIVKGHFADVPNIPAEGNSRYAGVIGGGKFLELFAKELECPWIHIDMAPRMTAHSKEFLSKGAAGAPVRFLLKLIEKHAH